MMAGEILPPEAHEAKLSFANFAALKARHEAINVEVRAEIGNWAQACDKAANGWRKLIPYLYEQREVLSKFGKLYSKDNRLPGWMEWYDNLRVWVNAAFEEVNLKSPGLPSPVELPSLRMIQLELKRLTDGTAEAAASKPMRVHKGGRPKGSTNKPKSPKPSPTTPATTTAKESPTAKNENRMSMGNALVIELLEKLTKLFEKSMADWDTVEVEDIHCIVVTLTTPPEAPEPPAPQTPPPVTRVRESKAHKETREFEEAQQTPAPAPTESIAAAFPRINAKKGYFPETCPVCKQPYLRWLEHNKRRQIRLYVHTEHREKGKRKVIFDVYCCASRDGADPCPVCGEPYTGASWSPKTHAYDYWHDEQWNHGTCLVGRQCEGTPKDPRYRKSGTTKGKRTSDAPAPKRENRENPVLQDAIVFAMNALGSIEAAKNKKRRGRPRKTEKAKATSA